MVHLEGDKEFTQPLSTLWAKLSDTQYLAECVPGMVSIRTPPNRQWSCSLGFCAHAGSDLRRQATPRPHFYEISARALQFQHGRIAADADSRKPRTRALGC